MLLFKLFSNTIRLCRNLSYICIWFLLSGQTTSSPVTVGFNVCQPNTFCIIVTPSVPQISCYSAPGTMVGTLSILNGDNNPVTYTIIGGDSSDFVISGGDTIVVGGDGIGLNRCSTVQNLQITASQN